MKVYGRNFIHKEWISPVQSRSIQARSTISAQFWVRKYSFRRGGTQRIKQFCWQASQEQRYKCKATQADQLTKDLQIERKQFPKRRKAFLAAPNDVSNGIPVIDSVIIVEGMADFAAVYNAVCAPIFVFGGAGKNDQFCAQLEEVCNRCENKLIVLTDADLKGRQLRNFLEDKLGPLRHAFIPVKHCLNTTPTKHHEIGNIGVEHASVKIIQAAIQDSQQGDSLRKYFTREDLEEWNLLGKVSGDEGAARRSIFCNVLGIGNSNGKQLLKQINRYGFQKQQVLDALQIVDHRFDIVVHLWKNLSKQHEQSISFSDVDYQLYIKQNMKKQQKYLKNTKHLKLPQNQKSKLNQLIKDVNQHNEEKYLLKQQ